MTAFATFYGEHAEHWLRRCKEYNEAAPQLILQAYPQRVVNGGGRIEREYGRGRTGLLALWPREAGAPYDLWRHFVVERKALRDSDRKSLEGTVERGVEQTPGHMKKRDAEEGHPVVFDRRAARGRGPPQRLARNMPQSNHALLQHRRAGSRRRPLCHSAAQTREHH